MECILIFTNKIKISWINPTKEVLSPSEYIKTPPRRNLPLSANPATLLIFIVSLSECHQYSHTSGRPKFSSSHPSYWDGLRTAVLVSIAPAIKWAKSSSILAELDFGFLWAFSMSICGPHVLTQCPDDNPRSLNCCFRGLIFNRQACDWKRVIQYNSVRCPS